MTTLKKFLNSKTFQYLFYLFVFFILLKSAWLADDAYISFRTVDNFVNGYGLRWNIHERVQVFTHPLWLFLVSAFVFLTGEVYFTVIFLSLALSMLAIIIMSRKIAASFLSAYVAMFLLISSKSFVDYTTSGLENSLTFFLLAIFFWFFFKKPIEKKSLLVYSLITSFLLLNRLDLVLIILPAFVYVLYNYYKQFPSPTNILISLFLGFLPLMAWFVFSLIYFGFLFPNTAYAKLFTGIPAKDLFIQGIKYIHASFQFDPILLISIMGFGLYVVFAKNIKCLILLSGVFLHLLYVVKIGGDFMNGRFLVSSFFIVCIGISTIQFSSGNSTAITISAFTISLFSLIPPFMYPLKIINPPIFINDVADERAFYEGSSSLMLKLRDSKVSGSFKRYLQNANEELKRSTGNVVVLKYVGFAGYEMGQQVIIIDNFALTDPLLSRTYKNDTAEWRIGHIPREIPEGYIESVRTGTNQIKDERKRELYEVLKIITQDPVWSRKRFLEIYRINMGKYNHLMN